MHGASTWGAQQDLHAWVTTRLRAKRAMNAFPPGISVHCSMVLTEPPPPPTPGACMPLPYT